MPKESMKEHFKNRFAGDVSSFSLTPPLPSSLNIELNNTCNQKCFFCPFHGDFAKHKLSPAVMKKEKAIEILDRAWPLGIGRKEVGLYLAGEPLLYEGIEDVIRHAKGLGFPYIFLTSNGVYASVEKMKKIIDSGLDSIRFSVNAFDEDTYRRYHGTDHFSIVKNNIIELHKYITDNNLHVSTSISCVITKETYGIRSDFKSFFCDYVDEIIFLPMSLSRSIQDPRIIEKYALDYIDNAPIDYDYICPLLFNTIYISANGNVLPCCEAYDYDCTFGDLNGEYDLVEIWNNSIYQKYRSIFVEKAADVGTICHNCPLRKGGINSQLMPD